MPGLRDFISKFNFINVQQAILFIVALVVLFFFVVSYPQRAVFLKNTLPKDVSMKWFQSFPSKSRVLRKVLETKMKMDPTFFNNLAEFALTGKQDSFKDRLDLCIEYYGNMQEEFSWLVSAGNFKGFCQYYKGQAKEAENSFNGVVKKLPKSFWIYYDLAIINFKAQKIDQANEELEKVLKIPPDVILESMLASPLYRQLMESHGISAQEEAKRIEQARQRCSIAQSAIRNSSSKIDEDSLNKWGFFVTIF